MIRREMGSKRGSLPPKEGDLTCMYYSYFLHKGIWVLFSHGSNFCKEDKSAKKRENFHFYSTC